MPKGAVSVLALVLLVAPAAGQDTGAPPLSDAGDRLELAAAGQTVTIPFPDWLSERAPSAATLDQLTSLNFEDDGEQALLEIYPRGEGEAFWSTLYSARVTRQEDAGLADLRSLMIDIYARPCRPETVALFQLEPDDGDNIPPLGFVCGAYRNLPGYSGQGEVMVIGFYRSDAGAAMVYQQWRGEAFNPADASTWPVSTEVVEERIAQLRTQAGFAPVD